MGAVLGYARVSTDGQDVIVHTGDVTDGTHTIEVQESDDTTTWTAVADADLQGTELAITSADSNSAFAVGYTGGKRHLRVNVTVGLAGHRWHVRPLVQLGQPSVAPVTRP